MKQSATVNRRGFLVSGATMAAVHRVPLGELVTLAQQRLDARGIGVQAADSIVRAAAAAERG